jgi:transposase-like protein
MYDTLRQQQQGGSELEQTNLVSAGSFCWNPECPDYAQVGHQNIRKFGRTNKGVQRYQCKTCAQTFSETKGTVFHGCHHSQETVVECLAMLADRNSLAAIHRIKGVKEETVCEWLQRAAQHVEEIEAVLLANYPVSRAQLDALWTYVGHKGEKGGTAKRRAEAASGVARRSR